MSAHDLVSLQKDLEVLERFRKDHPALFFRPNNPQKRMFSSDATYRCLFGGNKVGKSTFGVLESISYCIGYRPFLRPDHARYRTPYKPPVKGMCFAETWDKTDEILNTHFNKWLPRGEATPIRRQGRGIGWQFRNGSEIRYGTYQMDPDRMEGADKHFYWFDEPPPYALWTPVTRGIVVHGGRIWLTLTLLSEGWIWDEIWERHDEGDPDYYATTGDIRDNLMIVNPDGTVTGALDESSVQRFEKTLTDQEREVRLHGKPQHLQGRIFKEFRPREPWLVEESRLPSEWPCIRAIDPALSKPMAVLWARITPSNRLIVTDELYDSSIRNMDQLKKRMDEIEHNRHHKVKWSTMDSWGNQKDVNGKSMIDIFRDYGISCTPAPKADKRARVYAVAEAFKVNEFTMEPGISIFKGCERLVWEIKRYVHPPLRNKSRTEMYKDIPEGSDKKDDDLIDCLLFMKAGNPTYEKFTRVTHFRGSWDAPSPDEGYAVMAEEYEGKGSESDYYDPGDDYADDDSAYG